MTDEEAAVQMRRLIGPHGDNEADHSKADDLVISLLEQSGYKITASLYRQAKDLYFWYA